MVVVAALLGGLLPAAAMAANASASGHFVLSGDAALNYAVPRDVRAVSRWRDRARDLEYTRYQQHAAPLGVHVSGAQLTVVTRAGKQVLVMGNHYAGLRTAGGPRLDAGRAGAVARGHGERNHVRPDKQPLVTRRAELRLDPDSGRLFYLVASGAPGVHLFHEIDAQTGAVLDSWDAMEDAAGDGTGVKGDTKDLIDGPAPGLGSLTSFAGGAWKMQSQDGRFRVLDAKGKNTYGSTTLTDNAQSGWNNDNVWAAAYQRPAVDAQYYAALTVAFYEQRMGFDMFADCDPVFNGQIRSVVHYDEYPYDGHGYANAFWDAFDLYMVYGDGNGGMSALSGGQDVVSHELTHAVTQCRADLEYQDQPGALNEAFSDIMAVAAEWDLEEPLSSNCHRAAAQSHCADWRLGEDIMVDPSATGFRDFADPEAQDQPSHWEDRRYLGNPYVDNGGVHFNSGIVNHAFYLLVNGGRNARCSGPTDTLTDCDVLVPGVGLEHAEQIFFAAFGGLATDASFCDAREATLATADLLYPSSVADTVGVDLAWAAVGRGADDCGSAPADFSLSLSEHSLALAPGATGQLDLTVTRGTQNGPIDLEVQHAAPLQTATFTPDPSVTPSNTAQLNLEVAAAGASGIYPLLVTGDDGSVTHYASAALVVDGVAPAVGVTRARFLAAGTVSTGGVVPLRISWTATDGESGLASTQLDHSPNGSGWAAIYGPGAFTGLTAFDTTAGPHQFRAVGVDAVGNTANATRVTNLAAAQETAPVYSGTWTKSGTGTTWGSTRFARVRGAKATYTFSGTDVAWVAQRGPKRGRAWVYVDGVRTVVNLYAAGLQERRIVFIASGLSAGQHTLRVVCRGTSGRPRVDVDGFFVLTQ